MKLQELAIYGVNKVSQMLKIDIPEVVFLSESEIPNKNLIGSFIPEEYLIVFNKDLILASEPMNIIITCFHEVRHAYQYFSVKHNINETKETLDKWKHGFANYSMPYSSNIEEYDKLYLSQEIELDAIIFTHKKIQELFGIKTILPDSISKLL